MNMKELREVINGTDAGEQVLVVLSFLILLLTFAGMLKAIKAHGWDVLFLLFCAAALGVFFLAALIKGALIILYMPIPG